ncbi:MAG: hypothetical protein K2W96_04730 [Gemmataceae bacterium]|nr:hypothetical protein [Gemmataceae bacterium]
MPGFHGGCSRQPSPRSSVNSVSSSLSAPRAASSACVVRVLDAATGVESWRREGPARAVAFHPDGRLAVAEGDGVSLLGPDAEERRVRTGAVHGMAFSADGTRLATAVPGGVRVWELEDGRQVLELPVEGGETRRLLFGADGVLRAFIPRASRWQAWNGGPAR